MVPTREGCASGPCRTPLSGLLGELRAYHHGTPQLGADHVHFQLVQLHLLRFTEFLQEGTELLLVDEVAVGLEYFLFCIQAEPQPVVGKDPAHAIDVGPFSVLEDTQTDQEADGHSEADEGALLHQDGRGDRARNEDG